MSHYNKEYFSWQKRIGEFGGKANLFKFKDFIKESDNVVDFGCGGAYLLSNINCKNKIGVEINSEARSNASRLGIKTVAKAEDLKDNWADVIISNNALEHVDRPLDELNALYKKIKKGGLIVFVVPHELDNRWVPNDANQHLYTWNSMCAGNLFTKAGFRVKKVQIIKHTWPKDNYMQYYNLFGETIFNIICRIKGQLDKHIEQVRVIATK